MRSNSHKVVDRAKSADRGPLLDDNVAAKRRRIGENDVIANDAIVRNVGICHDERVAAHVGEPAALYGATIDSGELADHIVISYFEPGCFARITHVLRCEPDRAKGKELIMCADPARAFHHNVRNELTCLAQFNLRTDPTVRPYCAGGMDLGAWIDDGCRMNAGGSAHC